MNEQSDRPMGEREKYAREVLLGQKFPESEDETEQPSDRPMGESEKYAREVLLGQKFPESDN
jgi:hypothetical protein